MKPCLVSIAAGAVLAVLSIAPAAAAPSFNCRTASLPAEKTICASTGLSRLDRNMSGLYFDVIARAREVSDARAVRTIRNSQRAFLGERNGCGRDAACIRISYRAQDRTLRGFMRDLD